MATTANIAGKETVFDPLNHTRLLKDGLVAARATLRQQLKFTPLNFFAVAAVSMFEYWLYQHGKPAMAYTALATAIALGLVGIFALRLSRTAYFAAVAAYGAGSVLLVGQAFCLHCSLMQAQPMLIHAVIMRGMMQAYGKMGELHQMEKL